MSVPDLLRLLALTALVWGSYAWGRHSLRLQRMAIDDRIRRMRTGGTETV